MSRKCKSEATHRGSRGDKRTDLFSKEGESKSGDDSEMLEQSVEEKG